MIRGREYFTPSYILSSYFYFSLSLSIYLSPSILGTKTPPSVITPTVAPSDLISSVKDPTDLDLLRGAQPGKTSSGIVLF